MIQGKWKSDGTDADSTKATWNQTSFQGDSVSHHQVHTHGGSPMNLLYEMSSSPPSSTFYLQVTVTEFESRSTSISVGVARPEEFKKGYGIKGMFYNGNLTNGSAALKVSYGPRLSAGDVLVVEYTETNNTESIQIMLHLNGNCLGTGFCIPKTESAFVPCISVHGQLRFQTKVLYEKPVIDNHPVPIHPLTGKWTITEASLEGGGSSSPIWPVANPVNHTIVLSMEPQPNNSWSIAVKVANTLGMHTEIVETSAGSAFAIQGAGHVRSTMMMPPPPLDQVERKLSKCMETLWKEIRVEQDDGDTLSILSERGSTVAKCTRVQPSPEPACTSYN